jgi:hypothetical protein
MKKVVYETNANWDVENVEVKAAYQDFLEVNRLSEEACPIMEFLEQEEVVMYEDECANLNMDLGAELVVIADLGLWNGRQTGYRELSSTNLKDVFYAFQGENFSLYFDGKDLRGEDTHHDGTNHYLFRKVRSGRNMDALYEKIMSEEIGFKDARAIGTYTSPIKEVKEIFGW